MSCGLSHNSKRLQLCEMPTFLPTHHTQHLHFQNLHGPSPPSYPPEREQVLPPLCQPYQAINIACLPAFPTSACMLPPFSPTCAWGRLPTHLLQTTFSTVVLESIGSSATCFIPSWELVPLDSLVLPTFLMAGGWGCCLAACSGICTSLRRSHLS